MTSTRRNSIPTGAMWAPRFLELHGNRLLGDTANRRKGRAPRDLLTRFCQIAEASASEKSVVAFVKRTGLIGLCRHGLPMFHAKACAGPVGSADTVEGYRKFARCLDSLQRLGL